MLFIAISLDKEILRLLVSHLPNIYLIRNSAGAFCKRVVIFACRHEK